jgi:tetratricopeptide (TPR) repeat protein
MQLALNNFAVVLMFQQRWREALDPVRRSYELALALYPPESSSMIMTESNYGETLGWLGRTDEGLEHANRSLAAARKAAPDGDVLVGRVLRKRASILLSARDYPAAERDALEAHRQLEKHAGPSHRQTQTAAKTLITIYERWGRDRDAQLWRGKLASTTPKQTPPASPTTTP